MFHGLPDQRRVQVGNLWSEKVGGPGFDPEASRSRTVLIACPPVSRWLPRCPPELKLPVLGVRLCPPRAARCRESVPRLCPGARREAGAATEAALLQCRGLAALHQADREAAEARSTREQGASAVES